MALLPILALWPLLAVWCVSLRFLAVRALGHWPLAVWCFGWWPRDHLLFCLELLESLDDVIAPGHDTGEGRHWRQGLASPLAPAELDEPDDLEATGPTVWLFPRDRAAGRRAHLALRQDPQAGNVLDEFWAAWARFRWFGWRLSQNVTSQTTGGAKGWSQLGGAGIF